MNEAVTGSGLMRGRRGLIMGVANERSIAWSIAAAIAKEGGDLAFTFHSFYIVFSFTKVEVVICFWRSGYPPLTTLYQTLFCKGGGGVPISS